MLLSCPASVASFRNDCILCRRYAFVTLIAFRVLAGPKAAWRLVAGYTAGFFMLMALIAYGKRQRINISALSIGIDFMQVVSIFTSFGFQWPSGLSAIFTAASAATFNDQLLAPECTLQGWTFESKWFAVQLVPAAFVFLLVLLWIGKGVVVRREQGWACCVLGCVPASVHVCGLFSKANVSRCLFSANSGGRCA